jgi:hypothetical protein
MRQSNSLTAFFVFPTIFPALICLRNEVEDFFNRNLHQYLGRGLGFGLVFFLLNMVSSKKRNASGKGVTRQRFNLCSETLRYVIRGQ